VRQRLAALALIPPLLLSFPQQGAEAGEVQPFVQGSWQALRAAHMRRPTIVHLWGLTCAPCRVEMPEWGKLLQQVPRVDLVTIHAERSPPKQKLVTDMLADAGLLTAENWMFSDAFQQRLRYEIDPKWQGELPVTLLVGRDGATDVIVGPADLAIVRKWIEAQARAPE
jgi:thiol-disulfide isomerase/thioredoxin